MASSLRVPHSFFALLLWSFFQAQTALLGQDTLKVAGAASIMPPIEDAARGFLATRNLKIDVSTEGGSNGGLQALVDGRAQVAVITHSLLEEQRAAFPDVNFDAIPFGEQVVALAVSRDVWESGLRVLTRAQVRAIYEQRVTRWDQIGGAPGGITFFKRNEGEGAWEIFVEWLFGDEKRAPLGRFRAVNDDEDARNSLQFTTGSMSEISPVWIDGKSLFALGLKAENGKVADLSKANIVNGRYPLARPLFFVVKDRPTMSLKVFVDFMTGPRGQALMKEHGFLTLDDLRTGRSR